VKTLNDVILQLRQLGYPAVAVFGEGDAIAAIVVAESDDALRITMAMPEKWEILNLKEK
jgi:acetyl/propionyl-CoA carboxylase alpha subunit